MSKDVSSELKYTREEVISISTPDRERRMGVRCADWERIKSRISKVSRPIPWLSVAYSVLLGVFATSGLTIVTLTSTQGLSSWVVPVYACVCVSSLLLAIVLIILDRNIANKGKSDMLDIKSDMESIEKMFGVMESI